MNIPEEEKEEGKEENENLKEEEKTMLFTIEERALIAFLGFSQLSV